jgi:hypothetical protein
LKFGDGYLVDVNGRTPRLRIERSASSVTPDRLLGNQVSLRRHFEKIFSSAQRLRRNPVTHHAMEHRNLVRKPLGSFGALVPTKQRMKTP